MGARFLALIAVAAFAGEPQPWTVARAPHFEVYSNAGVDATRSLAAGFERLHEFFARQLGVAPRGTAVRVICFATAQEFAEVRIRPATDAFYIAATGGEYIVMPAGMPGDLRIPAHEYAHLLLHSTGWKLPAWIGEGISEVASTVKIGERESRAGGDLPGRSQALKNHPWMPMTELFVARHSDNPLFYAQSWALADLLLFSPKYAPQFPAFLASLGSGSSTEHALSAVYRTTPDALAADLRTRLARGSIALPFPGVETATAPIHVEPADGLALLAGLRGTIAFNRGDTPSALAAWKSAIDLGIADAGLCYRYAVLTDDRAALERALELDPAFDDARYKLALMEKSSGHLEAAVAHLQAMHYVDAARAFSYWIALGDALLDLNRRADAKRAFGRASEAAATDAERERATHLDWIASTELAVEFDGKQARTVRVPVDAPPRNPFIERADRAKSIEATLEHVDCSDDGLNVTLQVAGTPLTLSVPDPTRVQIRNAGGVEFELTCGPQQSRKVLVEYTASGILRGLELR